TSARPTIGRTQGWSGPDTSSPLGSSWPHRSEDQGQRTANGSCPCGQEPFAVHELGESWRLAGWAGRRGGSARRGLAVGGGGRGGVGATGGGAGLAREDEVELAAGSRQHLEGGGHLLVIAHAAHLAGGVDDRLDRGAQLVSAVRGVRGGVGPRGAEGLGVGLDVGAADRKSVG